jgi:hypothetical protein
MNSQNSINSLGQLASRSYIIQEKESSLTHVWHEESCYSERKIFHFYVARAFREVLSVEQSFVVLSTSMASGDQAEIDNARSD